MKRILLATASLLLVVPGMAFAQQGDHHKPGGGPGGGHGAPGGGHGGPGGGPGGGHGGPGGGHGGPGGAGPQIRPPHQGGPQIQPIHPGGGPQIQPVRPGRPGFGGGGPGRPGVGFPHRPGTGRPPNFRPVRGPAFRYPSGYRYRRWSIGGLLPSLFLSSSYFYDDWADLGVGPPPPGCRWVRYGPDLLLVRRRSGQIVDVIYGAFY